ncbi:MAG: RsmE family RNA methyltransferase, partial [Candidatus Omnitrophica bacterium]|nr:RsmE family RNA methyltransferase [Candidatus Omnitrophota bacterium]
RRLDTYDLKLFPTLSEKKRHLAAALTEHHPRNCIVFIGPEGDFSLQETERALQSGCLPVSLGDRVLRVDTAAIAVASYYSFYAHR